jgi:formylglycine-generating enzyme required for sulfatase activity
MGWTYRDRFEGALEQNVLDPGATLLSDLAVSAKSKPATTRDRVLADLQAAEKKLKSRIDDLDAKLARAVANFRLGENRQALDDLEYVVGRLAVDGSAREYRIITLAHLGRKEDARSALARFRKEDTPESAYLMMASVLAAELGEDADRAVGALEAAVQRRPHDRELRYGAARAFSLASGALSLSDNARSRQLAERSLQLLREAANNGDADFSRMDEDAALDPIRDRPEFAAIMSVWHQERRYSTVWTSDTSFEAIPICGLDPAAQQKKCRELIAEGHRPVSWSVTRIGTREQLVTASLWHRPLVKEEDKDRLAERQASAAISLLRMGKAEEVWPLLRHSPDPRLRSFIINRLSPLGALPTSLAAELDRIGPRRNPIPAPGQQRMDAVLFQLENSIRRALIVGLGSCVSSEWSPGEKEPLIAKLADLYRDDPDAGIHSAVEWTLRKWGQQEKLKELDARLMESRDRGAGRWYVNGQGQTFAVIEGPVEFRMGSPPDEAERVPASEASRRMAISRRFSLATKEVTVEQFQRVIKVPTKNVAPFQHKDLASYLTKFSPDSEGPWIGVHWYTAAHYCNWLSEQEGIPQQQWCYLPNEEGNYDVGMSIPADVLERTGYRLPTEAEWEYGCRAGAVTSRHYGNSTDLLDAYAWWRANAREHAWTCGSLLPNDLGLFDMHGNVFEWCQDRADTFRRGTNGLQHDTIDPRPFLFERNPRLIRGGAYSGQSAFVRSAIRNGLSPSFLNADLGFRLARTCP